MEQLVIFMGGLLIRTTVSLWPHSGQGNPPMYGDYEAQRHWMELTVNVPLKQWYSTDLDYWGLDYPPATAYHSYLMGRVANESWVTWKGSRGIEHGEHRVFMRVTVFLADLLVFFPAIWCFYKKLNNPKKQNEALLFALCYPGFILIDHGHFQYNCVSLGLTVAAVACIVRKRFLLASVFFSTALNYKQMSLYHSLPFFVYLLRQCFLRGFFKGFSLFLQLSISVILTFLPLWLPFLPIYSQVLNRLFPIARGVFEDKVANFWCAFNVVWKLKDYPNHHLAVICGVVTLLGCIPSLGHLWWKPSLRNFFLSLINCSLSFFLFSFQVHEKSILLPATAIFFYLPYNKASSVWFLIISLFSLGHLCQKDKLLVPFLVLFLSYVFLAKVLDCVRHVRLFSVSLIGCFVLLFFLTTTRPPVNLPDLWPLLVAVYSCFHFCLFYLYFHYVQFFGTD